ncbi:hypothetical protein [Saccharibacillus sp. JS10]|uniref:hypothetical protein n=1 Tax=Saccharibacillus sp. JS10 TaxID=2950552 RepID=UPI00210B145A|nr:hypothetical protein [Saccharibacillus sp. JS10]MCQ4087594.1 hypothetical protein [Saccharibacillus sp. JS10]
MKLLSLILICILFLSACSPSSKPDYISKNHDGVTATKKIENSDFEIRLFTKKVNPDDNTFTLEGAIRYTGNRSEIIIHHGDPIFAATLNIDGKTIGDPTDIQTIGLSATLKANEWLTQNITLQSSRTQMKSFFEKDGKITLHAYFDAEGYAQKAGEYLSLTAEEIPY